MAHKMCVESEMVTADMLNMSEFPELANSYDVDGAPVTIVNETGRVDGGLPEELFVPLVLNAPALTPRKVKTSPD